MLGQFDLRHLYSPKIVTMDLVGLRDKGGVVGLWLRPKAVGITRIAFLRQTVLTPFRE